MLVSKWMGNVIAELSVNYGSMRLSKENVLAANDDDSCIYFARNKLFSSSSEGNRCPNATVLVVPVSARASISEYCYCSLIVFLFHFHVKRVFFSLNY